LFLQQSHNLKFVPITALQKGVAGIVERLPEAKAGFRSLTEAIGTNDNRQDG
jgi:hypothetical protein